MKRLLLVLALIVTLGYFSAASAVEFIMVMGDGSSLFACEVKGSAYRVAVKYRGRGIYTVLPRGKGTSGVAGNVQADNPEQAARIACDER